MEFEATNLDDNPGDYGRASVPAAQFILAKAALKHMNLLRCNDASRESLMSSVINNPRFSLLDNFSDLWELIMSVTLKPFGQFKMLNQFDEGLDGYGHRVTCTFLWSTVRNLL